MSNWKVQRQQSYFFQMRKFHNQIKRQLYDTYTNNINNLLEICVGSSGDLNKWISNKIKNVVGYDINSVSIKEGERRVKDIKGYTQNISLSVKDLSTEVLQGNQEFDVVSCMFALHYFFESEQTFNCLIESIVCNLKTGGIFMCTMFDGELVKKRLSLPFNDQEHFNIKLIHQTSSPFGNSINVSIKDNSETNTNANYNPDIEYIVNFSDFVELMKFNGFDLIESKLFNTYNYTKFKLTKTQKDISFLNRMYVFVKN
jgi:mRNA (guanine-N7-)-methyltransferase